MACETGREIKCEREGLEILHHYYHHHHHDASLENDDIPVVTKSDNSNNNNNKNDDVEVKAKVLSMEEEILLLQSGATVDQVLLEGNHNNNSTNKRTTGTKRKGTKKYFSTYETGCRGSVFVLCTVPNNDLLVNATTTNNDNNDDDTKVTVPPTSDQITIKDTTTAPSNNTKTDLKGCNSHDEDESNGEEPLKKRRKSCATTSEEEKRKVWDPIDTVRRIIHDLKQNNPTVPRSRFVTRMIPMQVTCFASLDEIQTTCKRLLQTYLISSSGGTFKIDFRRRNCSNVTRTQVIDAVAKIMEDLTSSNPNQFSVNLTNPDYTIQIEICKTLCGMSIIQNIHSFHNFNLIEIQEKRMNILNDRHTT